MQTLCPRCGHPNAKADEYCLSCGRPLLRDQPPFTKAHPDHTPKAKAKRHKGRNLKPAHGCDPTR